MGKYNPKVSEFQYDQRRALLVGYEPMTREDTDRLIRLLVDNGISLERLRTCMKNPRAFQAACTHLELQRPLVTFASYVSAKTNRLYSFQDLLRAQGASDSLGIELPTGTDRLEALYHAGGGVYARLQQNDACLQESGRRDLLDLTVPIATFSLATDAETFLLYAKRLGATYGSNDWRRDESLQEMARNASFWPDQPPAREVRLSRFGFAESDVPITTRTEALEHLPFPGARIANLVEVLAAIDAYPRILPWLRLDPNGGSRGDSLSLWLDAGLDAGMNPETCQRICTVDYDSFLGTPRVNGPYRNEWHNFKKGIDAIPYVVPVGKIDPKILPLRRS